MKREGWLKERREGIGGSEAAAILGMNPYMTNVELWEYKT
jgi:predicted phage-related endonuclease